MEKNKKKGVSDIIATVLILLLTVSGASILLVVIYNFTTDNLTPDKTTCFEIQNKLKIISSESCYTDSPSKSTTIRVRTEADLKEFNLYLEDDSDMKVFIMKKGEVVVNARNIRSKSINFQLTIIQNNALIVTCSDRPISEKDRNFLTS